MRRTLCGSALALASLNREVSSPQWASFFVDATCNALLSGPAADTYAFGETRYANCLDLVRAVEASGHEIAVHHHPVDAPSTWDGFTDATMWEADRDRDGVSESYFADGGGPFGPDPYHLGDVEDMMAYLDALPAGGAGQIVSATTEEYPSSVRYSTAGGNDPFGGDEHWGDLASVPCVATYGEHSVWQLRMRLYTSAANQGTVREVELPAALASSLVSFDRAASLGFVTHAKNVAETGVEPFEALFDTLAEAGIRTRTVATVMEGYPETADDPSDMGESWHCPPTQAHD